MKKIILAEKGNDVAEITKISIDKSKKLVCFKIFWRPTGEVSMKNYEIPSDFSVVFDDNRIELKDFVFREFDPIEATKNGLKANIKLIADDNCLNCDDVLLQLAQISAQQSKLSRRQ